MYSMLNKNLDNYSTVLCLFIFFKERSSYSFNSTLKILKKKGLSTLEYEFKCISTLLSCVNDSHKVATIVIFIL